MGSYLMGSDSYTDPFWKTERALAGGGNFFYMVFCGGAFLYGNGFNPLLSFIQSIAMISILVWVTLALVGQEKIYKGNKTRFNML